MNEHDNSYLYAVTADPGKPLREARAEIERLTDEVRRMVNLLNVENAKTASLCDHVARIEIERDEANRQCDMFAHRNAVLLVEIDRVREQNVELRDRNTRLLSQIQELEAREQ